MIKIPNFWGVMPQNIFYGKRDRKYSQNTHVMLIFLKKNRIDTHSYMTYDAFPECT